MILAGTTTRRKKDADNSTTVDVAEMTTTSSLRKHVWADVNINNRLLQPRHHHANIKTSHSDPNTVSCNRKLERATIIHRATTTIARTVFATCSVTEDAEAIKTTSLQLMSARTTAAMYRIYVVCHQFAVAVKRMSPATITIAVLTTVIHSNTADAAETRTTSIRNATVLNVANVGNNQSNPNSQNKTRAMMT